MLVTALEYFWFACGKECSKLEEGTNCSWTICCFTIVVSITVLACGATAHVILLVFENTVRLAAFCFVYELTLGENFQGHCVAF